jgi:uncharacterized membrane protein YgdD (TMEM256/DUF423 family)
MMEILIVRCANCALSILVGASGGHKPWPPERKDIFHRGVMYHFMSGVGMILSSLSPEACNTLGEEGVVAALVLSTVFFQSAIALFSLPLYHRAFTSSKSLTTILPPLGSISMLIGWFLLAFKK